MTGAGVSSKRAGWRGELGAGRAFGVPRQWSRCHVMGHCLCTWIGKSESEFWRSVTNNNSLKCDGEH